MSTDDKFSKMRALINELELEDGTVSLSKGKVVCVNGKRQTIGLPYSRKLHMWYERVTIIEGVIV